MTFALLKRGLLRAGRRQPAEIFLDYRPETSDRKHVLTAAWHIPFSEKPVNFATAPVQVLQVLVLPTQI